MRIITILMAVLFSAAIFAAPAVAQNDPTGRYVFSDQNDSFEVTISRSGPGFAVTGRYTLDGQTCQISGSYFTATKNVKAQCRDGRSTVAVNGDIVFAQGEISTSAYLTLTIHNRSRGTYRSEKGISGSWRVTQNGANGARYTGTFTITQSSNTLSGRANWDNHTNGTITGTSFGGRVKIVVTYPDGLVGTYVADLAAGGTRMTNGSATSNRGGGSVSWSASKTE